MRDLAQKESASTTDGALIAHERNTNIRDAIIAEPHSHGQATVADAIFRDGQWEIQICYRTKEKTYWRAVSLEEAKNIHHHLAVTETASLAAIGALREAIDEAEAGEWSEESE